jgi:hypothetical protein
VLLWPNVAPASAELVCYGLFALGLWVVLGIVIAKTGVVASVAVSREEERRAMPVTP